MCASEEPKGVFSDLLEKIDMLKIKARIYKIYLGEYVKCGNPPLTFIEECNGNQLETTINELLDILP